MKHLYALICGRVDLIATVDIENDKGYPIVKAGGLITTELYNDLRTSTLLVSLEEAVCFSNKVSSDNIYRKIKKLVESDSSFLAIDEKFNNSNGLKKCCGSLVAYPVLDEILTAFSIEMPQLFDQSLVSAYLAYISCVISKKSQEESEITFLAALMHDIGLLFISRKVRNKAGCLTGSEWRQMQLHPIIAYKMLKYIKGFPIEARKAILDHHENMDGSGYPSSKSGESISDLGLLIGLLDDIIAIYRKKFRPLNRSLNDVYPIVQMNTHSYPDEVLSDVLQILKEVEPSVNKDIDVDTLRDLIEYTYQQQLFINKLMDIIGQIHRGIIVEDNDKDVVKLQRDYDNLSVVIASSGLQESSYIEWLHTLNGEGSSQLYNEIEHTRLMLEEVIYRVNSFYNSASAYSSKYSNEIAVKYKVFVDVYASTIYPVVPSSLENYWNSSSDRGV